MTDYLLYDVPFNAVVGLCTTVRPLDVTFSVGANHLEQITGVLEGEESGYLVPPIAGVEE